MGNSMKIRFFRNRGPPLPFSHSLLTVKSKKFNKYIINVLVVLANAKCHSGVIIDLGLMAVTVFRDFNVDTTMLPIVFGIEGHLLGNISPTYEGFTVTDEHAEATYALDLFEKTGVLVVDMWRYYKCLLRAHFHTWVVLTIVTDTVFLHLNLVCDMLAGHGHLVMGLDLVLITHQVVEAMLIDVHLALLGSPLVLFLKVTFGDDLATGLAQRTMLQLGDLHI